MHPLVRDLYKRVLLVGRDYPQGLDHVRTKWKVALRNPDNCPSCYRADSSGAQQIHPQCEKEIRKAVGRGRFMIREMVGVIQLKKYRSLKERYSLDNQAKLHQAMVSLERKIAFT